MGEVRKVQDLLIMGPALFCCRDFIIFFAAEISTKMTIITTKKKVDFSEKVYRRELSEHE